MRTVSELLEGLEYQIIKGDAAGEVSALVCDTRKITEGCMFVCIRGAAYDSHEHIDEIVQKGAAVIVAERPVETPDGVGLIVTGDTRYAMAVLSAAWYGHPAEKMKIIGITGTKGKTTTTYMVKGILEHAGYRVGLIGTIETVIGEEHIPASHTTPESWEIQEYFSRMVQAGCQVCVMEVSSQGLKMRRTAGIPFEIGIFTNLSPDHIGPGEHESFEEYAACKGLLFRQCRTGIANVDDPHFDRVMAGHTCSLETVGFSEKADYRASGMELAGRPGYMGVLYHVSGKISMDVEIDRPGRFSVYNSLVAIAVCEHFKVKKEDLLEALRVVKVKGRTEMVRVSDDFILMIDYAHNAMSLQSLLETLKEYRPQRLVCVFGCGGNRSKLRRYEMGEVSGRLADLTVITSDNPRYEEPQAIIDDIKTGMAKTDGKYVEILDRREAIRYVISHGQRGDVIVLAGKGHEDYQEIRGVKYPMDERVMIREILEELAEEQKRGK